MSTKEHSSMSKQSSIRVLSGSAMARYFCADLYAMDSPGDDQVAEDEASRADQQDWTCSATTVEVKAMLLQAAGTTMLQVLEGEILLVDACKELVALEKRHA